MSGEPHWYGEGHISPIRKYLKYLAKAHGNRLTDTHRTPSRITRE
jgi:hypothetical protein